VGLTTSAGDVFPTKPARDMNAHDLVALLQQAARKRDGAFVAASSLTEGAGGITITVTTNAGQVSVTAPFPRDAVVDALAIITREQRLRDNV
jgi:hypothetical protein